MSSQRFRTKLCRNFALGHCAQGEQCKYLHSTNIPTSSTYSAPQSVFPMMPVQSPISPAFAYPVSAAHMGYPWGVPSQSIPRSELVAMNWAYQPTQMVQMSSIPQPQQQSQPQPQPESQPPQFRPLSWRTTLCRHFIKNQGWCPLGDECGYIHDLSLAAHANNDIRFPDSQYSGRNSNRGRAGSKHSHCWAYVQGLCRVKDCPYLHPAAINLFVPHTPCLAWPNCTRGALCAYKHPEPLANRAPEIPPAQPAPAQTQSSPLLFIPPGSVQYHGTTYFPVSPPRVAQHFAPTAPPPAAPAPPVPAPHVQASPNYTWSYSPMSHSVPSGYSPYSPESLPFLSPSYEIRSGLPPVSIASNSASYGHGHLGMDMPTQLNEANQEATKGGQDSTPTAEYQQPEVVEEFPYQPPERQRVGHARRISVTLKSKEDSDALGLTTQRFPKRPSWLGHSQRDAPTHRSWPWAPDNMGAQPSNPTPGMLV